MRLQVKMAVVMLSDTNPQKHGRITSIRAASKSDEQSSEINRNMN